ncbi:DDE-type integrase/transposase/recombinase, partial [Trujillonella humicola]|uniref:DDE-type integrase/transposase/recombinase n=1 Tax=Trujillonella humicola TaxID=3383699 RepID=UPI003905C0F5
MGRRAAIMKLMDATLQVGAPIPNVAEWCRVNGVNERTFYRHRARVAAEGAWTERSRRPLRSPSSTPPWLVDRIVTARAALAPDSGADNIHAALVEQAATDADWPAAAAVPARSTINRVLGRAGLLVPNPRKRPKSSYQRFCYARPRDCYQIDGTEHTLADGSVVVAIDIIDDCTRMWVASHVSPAETSVAAIAALAGACAEFGPPGLVLADNGSAFTGGVGGGAGLTRPGRFTTAVTDLGARLIHSSPYHPQTLGKCERLHQTADKLLAHFHHGPAATIEQLQARLDQVRTHYNDRRRHSAVAATPRQAWTTAPAHGGPQQLPLQTDATLHRRTVRPDGRVGLGAHDLRLGAAYAGQHIT